MPYNNRPISDATHTPQVIFASMPFGTILHPSPALSCLSGALRAKGIATRCKYYSLDFARRIGVKRYSILANSIYDLAGDWVFAKTAFPDFRSDDDAYLERFRSDQEREYLLEIRNLASPFIEEAASEIVAMNPKIVGCSSTFYENCSSLALLRRVKELSPSIVTIMGGANCEGEMGAALHSNFEWLDYVLSGEGDIIVPALFKKILDGEQIGNEWQGTGLLTPHWRGKPKHGRAIVEDIENLPAPWNGDYFAEFEKYDLHGKIDPGLMMETSRGCWWGEKKACTFCGLNGLALPYRAKSPERAFREITETIEQWNIKSLMMTDNMLHTGYCETLFPKFNGAGVLFFYEISPKLTRSQLKKLAEGGVRWTQPGIEHLHDDGLKTLGKGNSAYHSVRFLKWAREYGISALWNFIYNFPNENPDSYDEVVNLIPLITHMQPPTTCGSPLRYDRFSCYHNFPERYQLNLKPLSSYKFIYPLNNEEISRLAYFFEDNVRGYAPSVNDLSPKTVALLYKISEWIFLFRRDDGTGKIQNVTPPMLGMTCPKPGVLNIHDTRPCALSSTVELSGAEAFIYDICDPGLTHEELLEQLAGKNISQSQADEILESLIKARLLAKISGHYLSLAVHFPCCDILPVSSRPGGHLRNLNNPHPQDITIADAYKVW